MKTYIVSSYIPNAEIDGDFLNALNTCAEYKDAELIISECKYNYKQDLTDVVQHVLEDELSSVLVKRKRKFNNNLSLSDFKQSINIIDPLSGLESIVAREGCLLIPFPRHRFKVVPRNLTESLTPRAIWCTGTISEPYYKDTKSGIRMRSHHMKGALVVEVLNKEIFNVRQLEWDGTGFYDLDRYYTKNSSKKVKDSIVSLSMGDDHALFQDPYIIEQTMGFIGDYKIPNIVRHDTLDCASISHHIENKFLTKAVFGMSLEEELQITADTFKIFENAFPWATQYAVASNHPEHLDRYLDEARYRDDKMNHVLALELAHQKAQGIYVYEYAMKKFGKLKRTEFLKRNDSLKFSQIENGNHGDYGPNGSRGNCTTLGLMYDGECTTGHTHTPEIGVYGNYVNGTSTFLNLSYTPDSGSTSWLNTHTAEYKNGTRTHIHFMPRK